MIEDDHGESNHRTIPLTSVKGLSSQEAAQRLAQSGPNAVAEEKQHPFLGFIGKFWAPVPWMLEITVILELYLGKTVEAIVIGLLLVFNAVISFIQENRAQNALALLRQRLKVQARVLRDGQWQMVPSQDLVAGDVIHLRMGDLIPADVRLTDGQIQMDQSALTGESAPVEGGPGSNTYAGAVVKRGEASGEVTATGSHTYFGKTAELVRTAKTGSHLEEIILSIVKYLVIADVVLVVLVVIYALFAQTPWHTLLPFALIILIASVPVALPATFTLATAIGAAQLAHQGVLATHLAAIEEAAAMSVLASDKTGTLTENRLALVEVCPYAPHTEEDVLNLGVLASEEATQDPLDIAIYRAAQDRKLPITGEVLHFTPFDPATKRSEALVRQPDGSTLQVVKGAPTTIAALTGKTTSFDNDVAALAAKGYRVLAVAAGPQSNPLQLAGLLAMQDMPRQDSRELIQNLEDLGVRVVMVTGDDPLTAQAVAQQVGITGKVCASESLHGQVTDETMECNIFAGVFPEDKFHLVQALQHGGQIVGMTGDGVNDAPALKQAEVGIAVSSATDVAKAAASLVLTSPGLSNILAAVKNSRKIYQRMLTYTLNKIIKTFQIALFLSLGFIIARVFVVTPLLIVLLLFANDFVTMSIATDNVTYSRKPDRWHVRALMTVALTLSIPALLLSFGFLYVAINQLHLPLAQMQTLMFVMLVFTGQSNVYLVRERRHFWRSMPARWMVVGTVADIVIVSLLATQGILMSPIAPILVLLTLIVVVLYLPLVDFLKVFVFKLAHME
ncbi:MAG: plasma-membrane proton-efflux P-type ATPase [Chloroflexi bacterium]|nr:plasma-membrane proton-efflux P-type ATPase [Chloroflexota bacterium]